MGEVDVVLIRDTRGIKSPLLLNLISNPEEASGMLASALIPTFCASKILPINNDINIIKIIDNFFIIFLLFFTKV